MTLFNRTTKPVMPTFKSESVQRKTLVYKKPLSIEQEAQIYKATGKLPKYDIEDAPVIPAPVEKTPEPKSIQPETKEAVSIPVKKKRKPSLRKKTLEPYYGWTLKGIEVSTRRIIEIASKKDGHKIGAWCNLKLKEAADATISGENHPITKEALIDKVKEEIEDLKAEIPKIVKRALNESIRNRTIEKRRKGLWQRIMNG